jgi:hypothetical protein
MTQPNAGFLQSGPRIYRLATCTAVLVAACLLATSLCSAQQAAGLPAAAPTASASHSKAPAKTASAAFRVAAGPSWAELTPMQQQSLKPLQGTWTTLTEAHKRKWLAISVNYPKISAPEQARVHSRMTEWAALSAKQRSEARLNFAEVGQHSTDEKQAKWQAYQQLSPEEKQKLAADRPKAQGAAPVVKPVPPQKLAVVPRVKNDLKQHPAIAGASGKLDHNTLLPQALPLPAGAPVQTN